MRKTSCRFVPHHWIDDQKQARLEVSQDFVERSDATPKFLNCIFTEDEPWRFMYDPETKRQSMEWRSPVSPLLKEPSNRKSSREVGRGREVGDPDNPQSVLPQNRGETELNRSVTCMVLKATANDRRHLVLCHDEFRGP
ncbi:hypothetical protein TNCV_1980641 [Trichonephila clavipes]|nr:hypothetical protein TNCV_1980641 [Trichonephila clavipes]